ncbi:hypothetical protein T10_5470 [Trichinella papuae]|uniref:DUF7041 domain-containing protein n=1 Tax=Trichinella papuae TaxID=268474 RepID=A0A0V1MGX7_9BILA|nr:hypothetical protein T10_5470 [Trichinella papuae]
MMPSRRNMNDTGHPLSNGVSTTLTVLTFNAADPEIWFLPLDLFFQPQHVVDFLLNALNLPNPFTTFQQLCLKCTSETQNQRILQALMNKELNDDKPSQFLRRIQLLFSGGSDDITRQLFLSKLPVHSHGPRILPRSAVDGMGRGG